MVKHLLRTEYLKYLGVVVFIMLWSILKFTILRNYIYLPGPFETSLKIYDLFASGGALADIGSTLRRFFVGFTIAVVIGLPFGLLVGYFQKWYATLEIIIDFFRSIPVTALFPLFILFFGISSLTITAMVTVACVFVIILNTAYGVIYVNNTRLRFMRSIQATWYQVFREVILFEALPFIFVGLRVSISFALIVVVVSEMFIGTAYGLGAHVYRAHETFLITDVYALIIIIGLIGYILNKTIWYIEKKMIHWQKGRAF